MTIFIAGNTALYNNYIIYYAYYIYFHYVETYVVMQRELKKTKGFYTFVVRGSMELIFQVKAQRWLIFNIFSNFHFNRKYNF